MPTKFKDDDVVFHDEDVIFAPHAKTTETDTASIDAFLQQSREESLEVDSALMEVDRKSVV